jgi:hypothetical protein
MTAASEKDMLDKFDLVSEAALANLLGITVESLRNRPRGQLPEFFKSGRRRLYRAESVRE